MNRNELNKRLIIAFLGIPLIGLSILYSKWTFLIFIEILMTLTIIEFYDLAYQKGFYPIRWLGILSVNLLGFTVFILNTKYFVFLLISIFLIILIYELFRKKAHPIINVSVTLFGVFYILLYSTLLLIRNIPWPPYLDNRSGGFLILWIFGALWLCDTGAYFVGSTFGKHKLYKVVSPKKTWEGAIGGFCCAVLAIFLLRPVLANILTRIDALVIGIIIGIFGQLSDLIESLFKRDSGVKDSGHLLPGHGGALDRFDSFLLIGPMICLYFYIQYPL